MDESMRVKLLNSYENLFKGIPLVDKGLLPLKEERCKMRIVAFVIGRNRGIDEGQVLKRMCEIRGLDMNMIPPLYEACQKTGVRMDYLMDYNKMQMLYEQGVIMRFENFLFSI